MNKCLMFVFVMNLLSLSAGLSAFAATTEEIIDAFRQDKHVQIEINKLKQRFGGGREKVEVVPLGSSCGVVGCYFHNLVVLRIITRGINPQTGTILAKVDGLNGKIGKITLVELSPITGKDKLQVQRRYSAPNTPLEQIR